VNTTSPAMKTRRRPTMSARRPNGNSKAAAARRKALVTQASETAPRRNSAAMAGSAMVTADPMKGNPVAGLPQPKLDIAFMWEIDRATAQAA